MKRKLSIVLIIAALYLFISPPTTAEAEQRQHDEITIEDIIAYTDEIGARYNICPELIQAVIERESHYNPDATNGDCVGLMQVSEKWHTERMERLGVTDLYDPYSNILVGTDYLAELWRETSSKGYGDDLYYVLMRYNMTADSANRLYRDEVYSEYAISIAERSAELEREHGK